MSRLTIFSVKFSSVKHIHIVVKQIFRTYSSCKTEALLLIKFSFSLPPSPWPPPFYEFDYTSETSYKWNHTVFVVIVQYFYCIMSSRFIHVVACNRSFSLLKATYLLIFFTSCYFTLKKRAQTCLFWDAISWYRDPAIFSKRSVALKNEMWVK